MKMICISSNRSITHCIMFSHCLHNYSVPRVSPGFAEQWNKVSSVNNTRHNPLNAVCYGQ